MGVTKVAKQALVGKAKAFIGSKVLLWVVLPLVVILGVVLGLYFLLSQTTMMMIASEVEAQDCVDELSMTDIPSIEGLGQTQKETAGAMWAALKSNGWSDHAAAAVMGNAWQESGFNAESNTHAASQYTDDIGGETLTCIGLFQWCHLADKQALAAMDGGWKSVENQVDYFTEVQSQAENPTWWATPNSLSSYYFENGEIPEGTHEFYSSLEDFKNASDLNLATTVFLAQWEIPCPNDSFYGNQAHGYPLPRPKNACWQAETQKRIGYATSIFTAFSGQQLSSGNTNCRSHESGASGSIVKGGMNRAQAEAFMSEYRKVGSSYIEKAWGSGGPALCIPGPRSANCVSFSAYFVHRYTSHSAYTGGDGIAFAPNLASALGKPLLNNPCVYCVASTVGTSSAGHTYVVLGIEGDSVIIGEANCGQGDPGTRVRVIPKRALENGPDKFVDVADIMLDAPKSP